MSLQTILLQAPDRIRRFATLGATAQANGGDLTLAFPTGWRQNMLALAVISYRDTPTFGVGSSGFTEVVQNATNSNTTANGVGSCGAIFIASKRLAIGDDTTPTFTRTLGNIARGAIICYEPGSLNAQITVADSEVWVQSVAGTTLLLNPSAGLGDSLAGDMIVAVSASARNATHTGDSWDVHGVALTEALDDPTNTGADCGIAVADYWSASGESTSEGNVTISASALHKTCVLLLRQR